jgi:hypothetical protein
MHPILALLIWASDRPDLPLYQLLGGYAKTFVRYHLWPELKKDQSWYFPLYQIFTIPITNPKCKSYMPSSLIYDSRGYILTSQNAFSYYIDERNQSFRCIDSGNYYDEAYRYYNLSSGEIIQNANSNHYDYPKINLLLDMQTHLKSWPHRISIPDSVNISVSAVDSTIIYFEDESFDFGIYDEYFNKIREFTTCETEIDIDDDTESYIDPDVFYTDGSIDSEGEIAYSQYKHIGFLDITGLVVIYDVYGKKVSQWNASVIDINHTEKKLSYQLIMLPENFLVIIEQSRIYKNEYPVGNLYFYSIFGKKYKTLALRDIVGESVIRQSMPHHDSIFYTLCQKELMIVYGKAIYVVPVF